MHEFRLTPSAPFGFETTATFMSPGTGELVDVFDGKRFTRLVDVKGRMRLVLVSSLGTEQRPDLIVTLMNGTERDKPGVVALLSRMMGMSFDPAPFYELCRRDQSLYGLSSDYYGLRPTQRMHPFEAITLAVASHPGRHYFRASISNVAEAISYRVAYAGDTFFAFPTARVIAKVKPEEMVQPDFNLEQARQLNVIAQAVMNGELDIIGLAQAPLETLVDRLAMYDGIGLLGAQLTAIIGYGRLDCFPSADPLLLEWLGRSYGSGTPMESFEAEQWAEGWSNYRGLVAFHIYAELMAKGRL